MPSVILSYDIQRTTASIHDELKRTLIETFGFTDMIQSTTGPTMGQWYQLPNTCLRKENTTVQQANDTFISACRTVNAHWEKYIVTETGASKFNNQQTI